MTRAVTNANTNPTPTNVDLHQPRAMSPNTVLDRLDHAHPTFLPWMALIVAII
jgi:hypothetical protein